MSQQPSGAAFNRRAFLRATAALAAAAAVPGFADAARAAAARRPHILYILADDIGWADMSFRGSDIKTPNIDKLAKTGRVIDEFYTQQLCTPSRAALMTGRYPMRYGLQTGVIPSGAAYGLAEDEVTLPQVLKRAGYSTIMVGKWHLGHAKQSQWPKQRGFDYAYGPLIGEIDHFKHTSHGIRDWFRNNVPVTEPGYDTDLFGNDAIKQIDAHDPKKPLFLYLAFTAPHSPYQAPQDQLDRNKHIADPQRRAYAGQMTAMDDQIGRVLKALERRGMRDNTLIIFHSDNGGTRNKMFAGEAAVSGDLPPQNTPLRDGKGSLYEGGVRTGAIMNWPGKITPGTAKGMMHVVDMMPTLAALAGASTAGTKPLDGMDVWAAVTGGASPRKEVLLNIDPTGGALRDGDWKMVWLAGVPGSVQLYNLANDVGEKTDVAAANPEVVARMQARIVDYAKQMTPPLFAREAIRATYGNPPPFGKKPKSPDYEED